MPPRSVWDQGRGDSSLLVQRSRPHPCSPAVPRDPRALQRDRAGWQLSAGGTGRPWLLPASRTAGLLRRPSGPGCVGTVAQRTSGTAEKLRVLSTPQLPVHLPGVTQKDTLSCTLPNGVVWMLQPKIKELINYYAESQALFKPVLYHN